MSTQIPAPRPMYWSVRRELWENRSIYLAPLIVAVFVLFATAISTMVMAARRVAAAGRPLDMAPAPIMMATFIVGFVYCLDALYGERRDRSILFWKSLPVSDVTTVLSKASIPLVVLPLIAYVLSIITQILLLPLTVVALTRSGANVSAELDFFQGLLIMAYGLIVHALWFAPIYGWLLLVSAWARRAPVLWALMPPLAIAAVERILFNTWTFMYMLQYRVMGAMREGFNWTKGSHDIERLSQLTPGEFLSAPGLWVGLLFAAGCLAAAVRLRRNREPI